MTLDAEVVLDAGARRRLLDRFGAGVGPWCDALPSVVAGLAGRWDLEVRSAMSGGTGRALLCRDGAGRPVVLKLTPEPRIAAIEAAALRAWSGSSRVVELLDHDPATGAVLMEGLVPGTPLAERGARIELGEVAELLAQLHQAPAPASGFPSLTERVDLLFALAGRRVLGLPAANRPPAQLLDRAHAAARALAAGGPMVLLHGDLHPGNVLDAGPARGAVAIDPRPCVGDPAFDAVDWAFLPMAAGGDLETGLAGLRARMPALDVDRLRWWCHALAVLLAVAPLRRHGPTAHTDALLELSTPNGRPASAWHRGSAGPAALASRAVRSHSYDDVLAGPRKRRIPEVAAEAGLVVEDPASGFCGAVVKIEYGNVVLADRHGRHRVFPLSPAGFLLEGKPVTLVPVKATPKRSKAISASGSVRVEGLKARTARDSRIWVEGKHDAELVERVWGHDLRVEGVVVEPLDGVDVLADRIGEFGTGPHRRLGVLVDHLVPGSKESRIVGAIRDENVLVTGHPYVDVWQAVRPAAVGIAAWPQIPRDLEWKQGVCAALGWGEPWEGWQRVLAGVRSFRDLETPLIGAVERLIDFVTPPGEDR